MREINNKIVTTFGFEQNTPWQGTKTSTTPLFYDTITLSDRVAFNLKMANRNGISANKNEKHLNTLKRIKNITENGGSLYSMDFETIGSLFDDATDFEKEIFTTTEAILKKATFFTGPDGKIQKSVEDVHNIVFGINEKQSVYLKSLVNDFLTSNRDFSSTEKSTLERLSRMGASLNTSGKFNFSNGFFTIANPGDYNKLEPVKMINAVNELRRIGSLGYTYNSSDINNVGYKAFMSFVDSIEEATNNGNLMIGYNTHKFDMPLLKMMATSVDRNVNIGEGSVDLFEIARDLKVDFTKLFEGVNIKSNYGREENLVRLMKGLSGTEDFHNASFDVDMLISLLHTELKTTNETIVDTYINKATENLTNVLNINNSSDNLYRVSKGLPFKKTDGTYVKNGEKTFDFVLEKATNDKYKISPYKQSTLLSDNIYKFDGIQVIDSTKIPNYITKETGDTEKLFIATFTHQGEAKNKSVIIRKTLDDIQSIFDENLEITTMDSATIATQHLSYELDQTRRIVEGFTQPGRGGYKDAKKYYGAYNSLMNEASKLGINELTKEQVTELIKTGTVALDNNKNITINALKPLMDINTGAIYTSQAKHFEAMYEYLNQTAPIANTIIDVIDLNADKVSNDYKTAIFRNAYIDSLQKLTDSLPGDNKGIIFKHNDISDIKKSLTLKLHLDGEDHYINTSSPEKIKSAIKNIAEKGVSNSNNKHTKNSNINKNLNKIYSELQDRGLLSPSEVKELRKIQQENFSYERVANSIFDLFEANTENLTEQQLTSPKEAKDILDKKIKELVADEKDFNKKAKKYKNEFKKYTGTDAKKNLNNDISTINKKVKELEKKYEDFTKNNQQSLSKASPSDEVVNIQKEIKKLKKEKNRLTGYKKLIEKEPNLSQKREEKIALLKQKKQLNFIIDNSASNAIEVLDLKNGPKIVTDGYVMPLKDFKQLEKTGVEIPDFRSIAKDSVISTPKLNGKLTEKTLRNGTEIYQNTEVLKTYLTGELGWTEKEAEALSIRLSGPSGVLNKLNKKGERDLAVSIIEETDSFNENKKISKLVFSKNTALNNVMDAIEKGESTDKMVEIVLPKAEFVNGARFVTKDGLTRVDYSGIDLYVKNSKAVANDMMKVSVADKSLITSTINTIGYNADVISDAINENKGSIVSANIRRSMNNVFTKAPGPTGFKYVVGKDGFVDKINLVNSGDLAKNYNVNIEALLNFMPFLYEENDNFRKSADYILSKDISFNEGGGYYFKKWADELLHSGSEYGVKRRIEDVHGGLMEYFTTNLLGGDNIMDMILNSEFIKDMNIDDETMKLFHLINTNGSQVITESKVRDLMVSVNSAEKFTAFGDIVGANRPVIVQGAQYEHIQIDNLDNDLVDRLADRNFTLGRIIETDKMQDLLYSNKHLESEFVEGVTAKIKIMNDNDITNAVKNLKNNLSIETVEDLITKIQAENPNSHLLNMSKEDILTLLNEQANYLEAHSSVFMQRTLVSPLASEVLRSDTYHDINLKDIYELSLDLGDDVSYGTLIGYSKDNKKIYYDKKRPGKVVGGSNGKLYVKEYSPAIQEIKLSTGGVEKGIAHVMNFDDETTRDVTQYLWEELFGHDVSLVAEYELNKHMSASYVYNDIVTIAQNVLDSKDEALIEEFKQQLSTISNEKVATDLIERYNGKVNSFTYGLNFSDDDVIGKYENIRKYYREKGINEESEFYSELLEQMQSNEENEAYTVLVSKMQLNRQYGSQVDEFLDNEEVLTKHGGKMAYRDLFYLGNKSGMSSDSYSNFVVENPDGTKTYVSKPLVEHFENMITSRDEYSEALKDLTNIRLAAGFGANLSPLDILNNSEWADNIKISNIALNDVRLQGSNFSAEDMLYTFYGMFSEEGANVVEIDLGNIFLNNPLYKNGSTSVDKAVNKIYVPMTQMNYVDGTFIPNRVQKATTDLINNLQLASQTTNGKNSRVYLDNANISLKNLYEAYEFEIKNKDGILRQKLLSSRIDYSGHQLFGAVLSPNFNEDGAHINDYYGKNMTMKVKINNEMVNAPIDIEYHTKRSIEEMAGKNFIEDLGYQLVHENNFDNNDRFLNYINSLDIDFVENIDYERIGEEYLKTEGIQALSKRYPVFHSEAQIPTLVRLREYDDDTTSVFVHSYSAMKLKADVDGDMKQTTLLVEKGFDGRVKIFNKGDARRDAFDKMLEGEAKDNYTYWVREAIEEKESIASESKITIDSFREVASSKGAANEEGVWLGNWNSADSKMMKAKVRYNKQSIGNVSAPNMLVSEIASNAFLEGNSEVNAETYNDLKNFLKLTEQKLISSKHMTKEEAIGSIAADERYKKSITMMANGNIDDGIDYLMNALEEIGLFNKNNFDTDAIKSKNYYLNREIADNKIARGLGSLYTLFNSTDVEEIWNNPDFRAGSITKNNFGEGMIDLVTGNFEDNSFITRKTKKIYQKNNGETIRNSTNTLPPPRDKLFLDKNGNTFKINKVSLLHDDSVIIEAINGNDDVFNFVSNTTNVEDAMHKMKFSTLDVSSISEDKADMVLKNTEVGKTYRKGIKILNDLENEKILPSESKADILKELNNAIIQKASQVDSEFTSTQSNELLSEMFSRVYTNFDYTSEEDFLLNEYDSRYGSNFKFETNKNKTKTINGHLYKVRDTSSMYEGTLNNKAFDINGYHELLENKISESIENTYSNLDDNKKKVLKKLSYNKLANNGLEEEANYHNILSTRLFNEYSQDNKNFSKFANWNLNLRKGLIGLKDIDYSIDDEALSAIESVTSFGEAKIAKGIYTGYKANELSMNQLNEATKELSSLMNTTGNKTEQVFYKKNIKAINNYKTMLSEISSHSSDNELIQEYVTKATSKKAIINLSEQMQTNISDNTINETLKHVNEQIIEKARKMEARKITNNIDEIHIEPKTVTGKTLLYGVGAMVAASAISSVVGVAGSLDPRNTPSAKYEDGNIKISRRTLQSPQQQNQSNIYMSNNNYKISGKTDLSSINDTQIANAMNITFGNASNRVQINIKDGSNNDDRWFEKEISNYL